MNGDVYVLLKGHPCKLVEKCTAAPGKHGPANRDVQYINLMVEPALNMTYHVCIYV